MSYGIRVTYVGNAKSPSDVCLTRRRVCLTRTVQRSGRMGCDPVKNRVPFQPRRRLDRPWLRRATASKWSAGSDLWGRKIDGERWSGGRGEGFEGATMKCKAELAGLGRFFQAGNLCRVSVNAQPAGLAPVTFLFFSCHVFSEVCQCAQGICASNGVCMDNSFLGLGGRSRRPQTGRSRGTGCLGSHRSRGCAIRAVFSAEE